MGNVFLIFCRFFFVFCQFFKCHLQKGRERVLPVWAVGNAAMGAVLFFAGIGMDKGDDIIGKSFLNGGF